MNRYGILLLLFTGFLGLVVVAADVGVGNRLWGWLHDVPLGDKICHFTFMLTWTLLINLALSRRTIPGGGPLLVGSLIVALMVIAEEFSQLWIPGRSFDLVDLAADSLGLVLGDLLSRRIPLTVRAGDLGQGAAR